MPDCSTLPLFEHKLLAAICALPGRHRKIIPPDYWRLLKFESVAVRQVIQWLREDGWIRRELGDVYVVNVGCNCKLLRDAKKERRDLSSYIGDPSGQPLVHHRVSSEEPSVGRSKQLPPSERGGERTFVRSTLSQPLRSRGGRGAAKGRSAITTSSPSQLAGQRVSGRRVPQPVVDRRKRAPSPSAWQDRPVERWNAGHLAGYFDAMTARDLAGRSTNRFHLTAMIRHFAKMRREGISNEDCKAMIDLFVQQEVAAKGVVPSLWQRFIGQTGELGVRLTSNTGRQYNNQPGYEDEDDDEWL